MNCRKATYGKMVLYSLGIGGVLAICYSVGITLLLKNMFGNATPENYLGIILILGEPVLYIVLQIIMNRKLKKEVDGWNANDTILSFIASTIISIISMIVFVKVIVALISFKIPVL